MNKRSRNIFVAVLLLIGGTWALLGHWKAIQRLGPPGVRVVAVPLYDPEGKVVGNQSVFLPEQIPGYTSKALPVTRVELGMLPKDTTYGRRLYQSVEGSFELMTSVVLMGTDRTSIHQPQYCLTGQGWRIVQTETTAIHLEQPHPYDLPVRKLTATRIQELSNGEKKEVKGIYVYWFVADGELTAGHFQRMWWMARDLIRTGTLQRWAYISCFAVCLPGQEDATFQRLKEWIVVSAPEFQRTAGTRTDAGKAGQRDPDQFHSVAKASSKASE